MSRLVLGGISGLVGALALTAVTEAIGAAWGVPTIVEATTGSTPGAAYVTGLAAQIAVGGLAGIPFWRASSILPRPLSASLIALMLWMLTGIVLTPAILESGVDGRVILSALLGCVAYASTFGYLQSELTSESRSEWPARRTFLLRFAGWTVIAVAGAIGLRFLLDDARSEGAASYARPPSGGLTTEVTPNSLFYVVSKNEVDPTVELDSWRLEIAGLVDIPMTLTYDDLKTALPVEEYVTLECIGNVVGGDLIGNAKWKGVRLSAILEEARLAPDVVDVAFEAADGFTNSVSRGRAMSGEVLVVYEMNGQPLQAEHGFPARIVVPGLYGYKSVKWLTRIEPVDYDFLGYWESRGRTDNPIIKTMSKIVAPEHGSSHPLGPLAVSGVAFSGDRGIATVELSTDGERTWSPVDRLSEPLSPSTWVSWDAVVEPAGRGPMVLSVRAVDSQGVVQTPIETGVYPDGATGHHKVRISIGGA